MAQSTGPFRRFLDSLKVAITYALWAPLLALVIVDLLAPTGLITRLESVAVNLRFIVRAPYDPPADPRILYVGIDQYSLDHLGRWPWERTVEADFLKLVAGSGSPSTVAFDSLFTEVSNKLDSAPKPATVSPDQQMADAAGQLPSVVTGAFSLPPVSQKDEQQNAEAHLKEELAQPSLTVPYTHVLGDIRKVNGSEVADLPVRPLRAQSLFGFVNDDPSPIDNIRHTLPIIVRLGDKIYPSLSLQTLCQLLNIDPGNVEVNVGYAVRLHDSSGKSWTIPINEKGEIEINYRRASSFQGISFFKLYKTLYDHTENHEPLPPECQIDNKALVIGGSAIGLTDLGPTPLAPLVPLVYTHLNVINNVLKGDYLTFVPMQLVVLGYLLISWITLYTLRRAPLLYALGVPLLVVIVYTGIAFLIFAKWSIQIDLAWPVLAYISVTGGEIVQRWRQEMAGRQEMKQIFSRMLSPEVMDHMLDQPGSLKLGGSTRAVTILFSDIRDYTKFSENISVEELVRQLNLYFEEMVKCIMEEQGTCHKFIGDAIMAVWGDIPATSSGIVKDAKNAVRSALKMRLRLHELNEGRIKDGLVPLRIGIGLNHGDVLAGQIGATVRSEWTVMGDAVNTASRLEGMTKTFHTDLAIGDSVRVLIGDEFLVRRLGLIVLKGKTKPTVVWEVLAAMGDLEHSTWNVEAVTEYETGFDCFLRRQFAEAEQHFKACLETHPDDYCAETYRQASREFIETAPPADWDGRIVMTSK